VAIWITVWIEGLFTGFVTIGRYRKWLTGVNLLLILICQMAVLASCAFLEVCTVPVLLVSTAFAAGSEFTSDKLDRQLPVIADFAVISVK